MVVYQVPALSKALMAGILATGCDVIDIGMVPTPLLYYAAAVLETKSGVMLTGSHNPPEYNGLKMVLLGETLTEHAIQGLHTRITKNSFTRGEGEVSQLEVIGRYINHVTRDTKLARPLKIVVDCGNSVPGIVAPGSLS